MKYLQINLENYGGFDVVFQLRKSELQARVDDATDLLEKNAMKFKKQLYRAFHFVHESINYFSSTERCKGPLWDLFREQLVDSICMTVAMTYKDEYLEPN